MPRPSRSAGQNPPMTSSHPSNASAAAHSTHTQNVHRNFGIGTLAPGILIYETNSDGEVFVAVDEGVLVKTGPDVLVSVRRALGGTDLGRLRDSVKQEFLALDERERGVRSVMVKLEAGFLRRIATFRHE